MHLKKKIISIDLKEDIKYELKNFLNKKNQYTIPIFIPHRGCKNECVFCNQKKISGQIKNVTVEDVDNIIKERLEKLDNVEKNIQIAFFGGSFTGIKISEQKNYLEVAKKYIDMGKVESIRLSTRPDYINIKILKMLKTYGVKSIELGVQSMDNDILKLSKRGHTKEDVIRASRLIRLFGFELGHQIMVGLPGSSISTEIYTIKEVLKLRPVDLRIYPVYVIYPSELYDMYKQKNYIPLTINQAIDRVCNIVKECQKTNIRIIRLGLQSTDEITKNNKEIVGPVCDNIAEYVQAKLILKVLDKKIEEKVLSNEVLENTKNLILLDIENKNASIVIGPKRINKLYLENKYKKYNIVLKVKGEMKT